MVIELSDFSVTKTLNVSYILGVVVVGDSLSGRVWVGKSFAGEKKRRREVIRHVKHGCFVCSCPLFFTGLSANIRCVESFSGDINNIFLILSLFYSTSKLQT